MFRRTSIVFSSIRKYSSFQLNLTNLKNKEIESITRSWAKRWVVQKNLCPWAARTLIDNRLKIVVDNCHFPENEINIEAPEVLETIEKILDEAVDLADETNPTETTLYVLPHLKHFDEFLFFHEIVERFLVTMDLEGEIQFATFHPNYQFAETDAKDISNYTNRSPFPILHLIRSKDISNAIETSPTTTDDVWKRNVDLMKQLGLEKIQLIQKEIIEEGIKNAQNK